MDHFEQRLRDEVIYLHSLWHQGPPRSPNPNFNPNPSYNPYPDRNPTWNPNSISHPVYRHHPPRYSIPSYPERFRNTKSVPLTKKIKKKKKNKQKKNRPPESDPPTVSDTEWPCEELVADETLAASGWPDLKPKSSAVARQPSAEELARFAAEQAQQSGLKAVQEFLTSNADSEDEGGLEEEDDEDYYYPEEDGGHEESEEFKFFLRVFTENGELRGYYEKKFEGGEFCCLVCGAIGKKGAGKRFKDCIALVQHSIAISRTQKRRAHRAYGQVICKVLGWNIDRLPTIVLSLSEPLGRTLAKRTELQGNDEAVEDSDGLRKNVDHSEAISDGCLPNKATVSLNGDTVESMDCNVMPFETRRSYER
ncbi:uncharacterized protein LOC131151347 isoform X2 [Malania oleifera]|uniref:uncharacterized protein LOC131151347 isoform X2 n=1 Tax=Malania oleifera TaxID=397392 RepID=UPI0025AE8ADF|nr:uncharacterized protein LOC131151347 isoform X2 [Malania oleifera]